jgi:hypothetical protein
MSCAASVLEVAAAGEDPRRTAGRMLALQQDAGVTGGARDRLFSLRRFRLEFSGAPPPA